MKILELLKRPFSRLTPSPASLIEEWSAHHKQYFFGQFGEQLKWTTYYGRAPFDNLPDTHGYCAMPNMVCRCSAKGYSIEIGWVEGVSMYGGGIARVKHFALNPKLTNRELGRPFLESILYFLKAQNATCVEFHESHTKKIEHYRSFFKKMGIPEIANGVWRTELYLDSAIPESVSKFHESLIKPVKRRSSSL
ncbi:hypothetical protein LOY46_09180 [Pseudomonas sichuanensis]|uniref:hypothetical protein n=1 Tax=Pseudomonas sichuanensis TaxID=2213015 RepID=UPI0021600EE3|nr:hypothetical protein [Pseudomonas sichuanensis]UVK84837.1 hypothetical protein LOY46_09180 [Pseudomonas sichuanensis]UVL91043.1 hypothetical protein LOY51_09250 [Pseudomonas sichuanensis]